MTATDRLLRAGVLLAVAGVTIQTFIYLVNLFVLDNRYYHLDVSAQRTAFTWAITVAGFAASCAALIVAARFRTGRRRMLLLGALLAWLSLDEFIEIHERLGNWTADVLSLPEAVGVRIWLLAYLPVLASAALLLLWSALRSPPRPGRYQLIGMGLLVAGVLAEGLGVLTKLLDEHGIETPHRLRAGLEEGLELGGWIVLASGLTAVLFAEPVSDNDPSPDR